MPNRYPDDMAGAPPPEYSRPYRPLPRWLARRLLRPGEEVTWVRGPRFTPWWECIVTHLGLFLVALAVAAGIVAGAYHMAGSWNDTPMAAGIAALALVFGTIYLLAIANAYFTRLVVTTDRLVLMQGYEVCKTWRIDSLPRSLRRYAPRADGRETWSVDLDALQTMLGGAGDQFADSKTLRSFGKQLDQIQAREVGRRNIDLNRPGD